MQFKLKDMRSEMPALVQLALPLIAGELGWVAMSLVDTAMLGRGPNAPLNMAAAALAQVLFNTLCFGVGGILLGLDTLIAQAMGAEARGEANRWLLHGLALAVGLSLLLLAAFALGPALLVHLPVDHSILALAAPAMVGLNYGTLPLLLYFALRRYLQAAHQARPIAFALISANVVNAGGDWLLIYGHHWHVLGHSWVVPAFGVLGSSWSTSFARLYLMACLAVALWRLNRRHGYGLGYALRGHAASGVAAFRVEWQHMRRLLQLGLPTGASIFVEIGIFALVTTLIGTFGRLQLAGHEVALQCASTTFMVPFAISAATAVRVGHAIGRMRTGNGTAAQAAAAGWSGILAGAAFMLAAALCFLLLPGPIARLFTPDPGVVAAAMPLLLISAGFQFFDGVQINASGALRGAGNTTAPLYVQIGCYWMVGMPLGVWLGFHERMGAAGLWWGLLIALTGAAFLLIYFWQRAMTKLRLA